jgi:hypothetical protein
MLSQRRMSAHPIMNGGAKEHVLDIVKKYAEPLNIYVGLTLTLLIIYIRQLPKWIPHRANTMLGRIFLFALTIVMAETYSWIYALLMALFVVLLLAVAPRSFKERFQTSSSNIDIKLVSQPKRWWSEEVLKEDPLGVEEDRVNTNPIQDNSNASNSTTSSK